MVDLNMPRMDGDEFMRRLQNVAAEAAGPAVVLTSADLEETELALPQSVSRTVSESDLTAANLVDVIGMALRHTETTGPK